MAYISMNSLRARMDPIYIYHLNSLYIEVLQEILLLLH